MSTYFRGSPTSTAAFFLSVCRQVQYIIGGGGRNGDEKKLGTTISKIFENDGEDFFRKIEKSTIGNLILHINKNEEKVIISLGGGGFDNEETRGLFDHGHAGMGIFSRKKGSVFTTGCTDWAYGLETKDVNQVTKNVMERFILGK